MADLRHTRDPERFVRSTMERIAADARRSPQPNTSPRWLLPSVTVSLAAAMALVIYCRATPGTDRADVAPDIIKASSQEFDSDLQLLQQARTLTNDQVFTYLMKGGIG